MIERKKKAKNLRSTLKQNKFGTTCLLIWKFLSLFWRLYFSLIHNLKILCRYQKFWAQTWEKTSENKVNRIVMLTLYHLFTPYSAWIFWVKEAYLLRKSLQQLFMNFSISSIPYEKYYTMLCVWVFLCMRGFGGFWVVCWSWFFVVWAFGLLGFFYFLDFFSCFVLVCKTQCGRKVVFMICPCTLLLHVTAQQSV